MRRSASPSSKQGILAFWREADVFAASLAQREGAPRWIFYEGPPTANGRPGLHHVESRDLQGHLPALQDDDRALRPPQGRMGLPRAARRAGGREGDRHHAASATSRPSASPSSTELCRESVTRYVDDWKRLTERIGFWIDLDDAYWTMDTRVHRVVWWSLKQLHDARPARPRRTRSRRTARGAGRRCPTPRSRMGYQTVRGPERLRAVPARGGGRPRRWSARRSWCGPPRRGRCPRTPAWRWTPDAAYVVVERDGETTRSWPRRCARRVLGDGGDVVATVARRRPRRAPATRPPYPNVEGAHTVVAGRLRLDGGRHRASCTWRRRSVRRTSRSAARRAGPSSSRWTTRAGSPTWRRRSSAGCS